MRIPTRKAPATHPRFWTEKFARNVARDRNVLGQLWSDGWHVLVVWECETKDPGRLHAILAAFLKPSRGPANYALDDQHALYEQAAESRVEYGFENES